MLKLKSFAKLIVILSVVFGLVGCDYEKNAIMKINISTEKSEVFVADAERILISLNKEYINDEQRVSCSSSNKDIATTMLNHVFGVAQGKTDIECSLGNVKSNVITLTVIPVVETKPKPVPPAPPESKVPSYTLKLVSLTSPINAGKSAKIVMQGKAGVEYSITVYYKSGRSKAAGLSAKTADSKGIITWMWKVGANTSPGVWSIDIRGDDQSIKLDFVVR